MYLSVKSILGVLVLAIAAGSLAMGSGIPEKKKKKAKGPAEKPAVQPAAEILPPPVAPVPQRTNGSLFSDTASRGDLFSDFKARRIGDLVFVNVVEASTATVASGAKRDRDSGTLGGIIGAVGALPVPGAAVAGGVLGGIGTRKFEGKGSTQRQSALTARIAARVIEVLPNGDLRIEAQKSVNINKEAERLTLSGIVRQRDLSSNNDVPTTSVGDLNVQLNGKGVASADNAPGWLFRLFDKISPF
jgi:flagellar L-ring protein precursor FlgH